MSTPSERVTSALQAPAPPLALRWILSRVTTLEQGVITLIAHNGSQYTITGDQPGPHATIQVHRPLRLMHRLLTRGLVGFAESYINGEWSSPCLSTLLTVGALNEHRLGRITGGSRLTTLVDHQ